MNSTVDNTASNLFCCVDKRLHSSWHSVVWQRSDKSWTSLLMERRLAGHFAPKQAAKVDAPGLTSLSSLHKVSVATLPSRLGLPLALSLGAGGRSVFCCFWAEAPSAEASALRLRPTPCDHACASAPVGCATTAPCGDPANIGCGSVSCRTGCHATSWWHFLRCALRAQTETPESKQHGLNLLLFILRRNCRKTNFVAGKCRRGARRQRKRRRSTQ